MEPMKKGHHRLEVMSHYYGKRIQQDMSNFVKWILLALLIGGGVGGASSLFAGCLNWVTQFRADRPVVVLLLPFGVDCIFISEDWKRGQRNKPGTLYDPVAG